MIARHEARSFAWLLLLVICLAAWIDCGPIHRLQNADSILPSLISIQHWTPFFWGQDRFGMLVPLLAVPFRNPFVNLLVQDWLTIAAALAAPFLAARYLVDDRSWIAAGALTNACLLLITSDRFRFEWLITQPYAVSMTLALAALLIFDRPSRARAAAASLLMLLAHWVNLTTCLVLVPLVVARRSGAMVRALMLTASGTVGGALFRSFSTAPRTTTNIVPAGDWPKAWLELLRTTWAGMSHPGALVALAILATIAGIRMSSRKEGARGSVDAPISAFFAALSYWAIVGTFEHVRLNEYYARYVFPSDLLLAVGAALLIVMPLWPNRRVVPALACTVFAASVVFNYGVPSVRRVRTHMDRTIGLLTPTIEAAGATVVAGEYWNVWPAVFHANVERYERTGRAGIYGLTFRSDITDREWVRRATIDPVVIAALRFDGSVDPLMTRIGVPVTFVGDRGPLRIYVAGATRR
jgi:hypothetical protein